MLDKAIRVLRTWETNTFSPGGAPIKHTHYEFRVGEFGPFYESFGAAETSADDIAAKLNAKALQLRELGVISSAAE